MRDIRVLIADHELLLRRLLAQQLQREAGIHVAGEAASGEEAVLLAQQLRPDVVLMKLLMPGMNGPQATERILAQRPETRIIMLSSLDGLESVGLMAGAYACFHTNTCSPRALVTAIQEAAAAPVAAAAEAPAAVTARETVARVATEAALTYRELRVLEQAVCTELTVQQIARSLSDEGGDRVTESAVRHTLDRIMTKLELEPRTRIALVKHVLHSGSDTRLPGLSLSRPVAFARTAALPA